MDFSELTRLIGNNLRKARWAKGLTQQQVAEKGMSLRYYQELERGQRNPTLRILADLAQILDTSVAALTEIEGGEVVRQRQTLGELDVSPPKRGRKRKG